MIWIAKKNVTFLVPWCWGIKCLPATQIRSQFLREGTRVETLVRKQWKGGPREVKEVMKQIRPPHR